MISAFPLRCVFVRAVWLDGVFKQYAVEVADLALSICSGG